MNTIEDLTTLTKDELLARIHALRWSIGGQGENYKNCEKEAKPLIDEYNRRGKKIAKKYNRSWRVLTFKGFPRTH